MLSSQDTLSTASTRKILITDLDFERIQEFIERSPDNDYEFLSDELSKAEVIPHQVAPKDLVTMGSTVRFLDLDSRTERTLMLTFPQNADVSAGRISLLSPVGTALLGLCAGETIEWNVTPEKTLKLRILAVVSQPKAS